MKDKEKISCTKQEAHAIKLLEFDAQITVLESRIADIRNKKAVYLYETAIQQVQLKTKREQLFKEINEEKSEMSKINELTEKVNVLSNMVIETSDKVDKILVAISGELNGSPGIRGRLDLFENQQIDHDSRIKNIEKTSKSNMEKTNNFLLKFIIAIATTGGLSSGATAIIIKLLN